MRRVGAALMILMFLAPLVGAQDSLEWYVKPKTENAEKVESLFNVVNGIALFVFIFVEFLLFYTVWRFRKHKVTQKGETLRGHTKAEIAWTIVPAVILIFIGVLSVQTLTALDTIPDDIDFVVDVEAQQFAWKFTYPDGSNTFNELRVASGQKVQMNITSRDVAHAVWIPQFAIKIDAYPGRINQQYFVAPEPGSYFLQCAEYCGNGHHAMHANVVVFDPSEQPKPYGAGDAAGAEIPDDVEEIIEIQAWDEGADFWFAMSADGEKNPVIEVPAGKKVALKITQWGEAGHNIGVDGIPGVDVKASGFVVEKGDEAFIVFTTPSEPVEGEYFCQPHRGAGMKGTLRVVA